MPKHTNSAIISAFLEDDTQIVFQKCQKSQTWSIADKTVLFNDKPENLFICNALYEQRCLDWLNSTRYEENYLGSWDEIYPHEWNDHSLWLYQDGYRIQRIKGQQGNPKNCDECKKLKSRFEKALARLDDLANRESESHKKFQIEYAELRNELTS